MDRQEALAVVGEVLKVCKCFVDATHVSIRETDAQTGLKSAGFEIHIKSFPNDDLRECLAPVLAKRQLKTTELMESIIIYKPKTLNETE
jgi:hypothetical protein